MPINVRSALRKSQTAQTRATRPGALVKHIKAVVHGYDGRISVTEAIGALEIAKLEIFEGQK